MRHYRNYVFMLSSWSGGDIAIVIHTIQPEISLSTVTAIGYEAKIIYPLPMPLILHN